jgi:hypothetical protein
MTAGWAILILGVPALLIWSQDLRRAVGWIIIALGFVPILLFINDSHEWGPWQIDAGLASILWVLGWALRR